MITYLGRAPGVQVFTETITYYNERINVSVTAETAVRAAITETPIRRENSAALWYKV